MRDRYVLQVLLVTLGFGVLLAVIAVVDTPNDAFRPIAAAPYGVPGPSEQIRGNNAKSPQQAPTAVDFRDECNLFFRFATQTETPPKQECDTSTSPHKKPHQGGHDGAKSGVADDC